MRLRESTCLKTAEIWICWKNTRTIWTEMKTNIVVKGCEEEHEIGIWNLGILALQGITKDLIFRSTS